MRYKMEILRLVVLIVLIVIGQGDKCSKAGEKLTCPKFKDTNRLLEGVKVLVIKRMMGDLLDLTPFPELQRVVVRFTDVTCDSVSRLPGTTVLLNDYVCPEVSETLMSIVMMNTTRGIIARTTEFQGVVTINKPWIYATAISTLILITVSISCGVWFLIRKRRDALRFVDSESVTEFSLQETKMD